jgi:hypothetical protein
MSLTLLICNPPHPHSNMPNQKAAIEVDLTTSAAGKAAQQCSSVCACGIARKFSTAAAKHRLPCCCAEHCHCKCNRAQPWQTKLRQARVSTVATACFTCQQPSAQFAAAWVAAQPGVSVAAAGSPPDAVLVIETDPLKQLHFHHASYVAVTDAGSGAGLECSPAATRCIAVQPFDCGHPEHLQQLRLHRMGWRT